MLHALCSWAPGTDRAGQAVSRTNMSTTSCPNGYSRNSYCRHTCRRNVQVQQTERSKMLTGWTGFGRYRRTSSPATNQPTINAWHSEKYRVRGAAFLLRKVL